MTNLHNEVTLMTYNEIPWKQIQKDYVLGVTDKNSIKQYPSYDELAETYDVSSGSLRNVGGPEKWGQQRKNRKIKVTRKALSKKSHKQSEKAAMLEQGIDPKEEEEANEYDAELIVASDEKFEVTGEKLRRLCELKIDALTESITQGGYVKEYALKMLGDALKSSVDVVKLAQGEPTENIAINTKAKYEVSMGLIGSDDHIASEMGILNAVSQKQLKD